MWIANAAPFIALLPVFLEIIHRCFDYLRVVGAEISYQRLSSPFETRTLLKGIFVTPTNGKSLFMDIWGYAEFDKTAGEIVKFHLAFLVSLYFSAVVESKNLLKVEGLPLVGIGILIASLFLFVFRLLRNKYHPAHRRPFGFWQEWTWVLFIAIVVFEGWHRLATMTSTQGHS
jgi:hypothetical protein